MTLVAVAVLSAACLLLAKPLILYLRNRHSSEVRRWMNGMKDGRMKNGLNGKRGMNNRGMKN